MEAKGVLRRLYPKLMFLLKPYEKLPPELRNDSVRTYYDILAKKRPSIFFKRVTDILLALVILVFLLIPMAVIAVIVKTTSKGPIFYRQERVTSYNRHFRILKFRSMTVGADKAGALVTSAHDCRVTKVGATLRKYRLDELPQIFHVLSGKMSFVGTRPEVPRYVDRYENEYYATLLLPAGITSLTSIKFKDEENLLSAIVDTEKIDKTYVKTILPQKMEYNLQYTKEFGFLSDIKIMFKTVKEVIS